MAVSLSGSVYDVLIHSRIYGISQLDAGPISTSNFIPFINISRFHSEWERRLGGEAGAYTWSSFLLVHDNCGSAFQAPAAFNGFSQFKQVPFHIFILYFICIVLFFIFFAFFLFCPPVEEAVCYCCFSFVCTVINCLYYSRFALFISAFTFYENLFGKLLLII